MREARTTVAGERHFLWGAQRPTQTSNIIVRGPHSPEQNTPNKAGIVGNSLVGAPIPLLEMSAQSSRTAGADVAESFSLLWRQGVPPSL
jgi:hypothetical protein